MERQPPVTGIALVAGLCAALDAEMDSSFDKTKRKLRAPIQVTNLSELALTAELRRLKRSGRGCGSAA